jgi:carbon storage regulator
MLSLTRKEGESVIIGDDIEITVVDVSGDKVRLGIKAPDNISVLRAELKQTAQQNKDSAAGSMTPDALAQLLGKK